MVVRNDSPGGVSRSFDMEELSVMGLVEVLGRFISSTESRRTG